MLDAFSTTIIDLAIEAYAALIGRPFQRWRAKRLSRAGKIRSVLFAAEGTRALPGKSLDGAAEVRHGRISLADAELWVQGIDVDVDSGPKRDGFDGDLWCRPKTRIHRLRTHNGAALWAVLAFQSDEALAMLGFAPDGGPL